MAPLLMRTGCASNLLPSEAESGFFKENQSKAIELVKNSMKVQRFEYFYKQEAYQFTAVDHWQSVMGTMGKMWPQKNGIKIHFPCS
ncbi:hypothetical protein OAA91_00510 [Fibrobacterales bacterium]|nr:hypothetical protein [Fibrobacterales bacterium]